MGKREFNIHKTKGFTVMSNYHFRDRTLSLKAKGLLSELMSLPENWDYSLRGLSKLNRDGIDAIRAAVNELERAGYITRHRERNELGQLANTMYDVFETPKAASQDIPASDYPTPGNPTLENPTLENPMLDNPTLGNPALDKPALENPTELINNKPITNQSNTYSANTNQSISDGLIDVEELRNQIMSNISYAVLGNAYGCERVDEVVNLIVDVYCESSDNEKIRIGKVLYPAVEVRSRLEDLTREHIEYVFNSIDGSSTKISNMRQYLLTALYRASTSMENNTAAAVAHELNSNAG